MVEFYAKLQFCNPSAKAGIYDNHQRVTDQGGAVFDTNGDYIIKRAVLSDGWRIVRRGAIWQTHSGDSDIWGNARTS